MGFKSQVVSVGTTATLLNKVQDYMTGSVLLQSAGTIYVGGPDVTASGAGQGFPVTGQLAVDLIDGENLYGIVASGTVAVNVLQSGL